MEILINEKIDYHSFKRILSNYRLYYRMSGFAVFRNNTNGEWLIRRMDNSLPVIEKVYQCYQEGSNIPQRILPSSWMRARNSEMLRKDVVLEIYWYPILPIVSETDTLLDNKNFQEIIENTYFIDREFKEHLNHLIQKPNSLNNRLLEVYLGNRDNRYDLFETYWSGKILKDVFNKHDVGNLVTSSVRPGGLIVSKETGNIYLSRKALLKSEGYVFYQPYIPQPQVHNPLGTRIDLRTHRYDRINTRVVHFINDQGKVEQNEIQ